MRARAIDVVLQAFSHEQPERVPRVAGFSPALLERFRKATGAESPEDYWDFEVRDVGFGETTAQGDFARYFPAHVEHKIARVNEWGVGHVRGSLHHFEDYVHPMAEFTSLAELEKYPWPDVTAAYRRSSVPDAIEALHKRGYAVRGCPPMANGSIFENAWLLRGLERLLVDLVQNQEFAAALLDRITGFQVQNSRYLANCEVDILLTGDDVGTQRGMMMGPDMWRKWLKPRLAKIIAAAKEQKPHMHVFYHSDGDVRAIVPDLIDIGVDVLNPVQPECMDPAEMKRRYGKKLSFWGTVGTQTTMPFSTPDDVRRVVHERIATVGLGGGLLLAPTHLLEPDVPWLNVIAFFEAIKECERKA
jgi:uroporphyrinogen decarboxylase